MNVNGFLKTIFQLQKAYQANIWKITEAHKVSKVQLARFANVRHTSTSVMPASPPKRSATRRCSCLACAPAELALDADNASPTVSACLWISQRAVHNTLAPNLPQMSFAFPSLFRVSLTPGSTGLDRGPLQIRF